MKKSSLTHVSSLAELFEAATSEYASSAAYSFMDGEQLQRVSYSEYFRRTMTWASFLESRGVKPGDRVAFLTPKCPQQFLIFYACWWLGAIAVPVCESLGDMEMGFIIRDCEPTLILAGNGVFEKAQGNSADIPVVPFDEAENHACTEMPARCGNLKPDDVATLIYTSGSTGMPKGVMLTHKNFCANASSIIELEVLEPTDVVMSLLPYWHSYALVVEVVAALRLGAHVAVPRDKRDFRRNIGVYNPTVMLVVPRIADTMKSGIMRKLGEANPKVRKLFDRAVHNASRIFTAGPRLEGGLLRLALHHALYNPLVFRKVRQAFGSRLKFMVSGGAPLDIEHQIFFKYVGIPVYQGYGLTEATPVVSTNVPHRHKLGTCGPLLPWLEPENGGDYTFRDENGNLGKDVHGELLVRGACVMKGYWRHADESAKTLADGWLHTGDMGYLDDDGFLVLQGREGNMICLVGGEKLHPEHVEDAVKGSDLVSEAMVIGESCKNVYVCVNVDPDVADDLSGSDLLGRVRNEVAERTRHLAAYQRPKNVLLLPEFSAEDGTLTVTMKVRRHKVWEVFGGEIRQFLKENGEEIATRRQVGIASSKVLESLNHSQRENKDS